MVEVESRKQRIKTRIKVAEGNESGQGGLNPLSKIERYLPANEFTRGFFQH
jgi:hypothetical protein